MLRLRTAAVLLGAVLLASCEKGGPQNILAALPGSRVRFFNLAAGSPSVNFYANEAKITAISAATCQSTPVPPACTTTGIESTAGTAYGSAGVSSLYTAMQPGAYTLSGRISAATDNNVAIGSAQTTLQDGKAYSFYLSGAYDPATKKVDAFVTEDQIPEKFDFSVGLVRFVNASANAGPLVLYAKNTTSGTETAIGSAVAYRAGGAFVTLPPGTYDMSVRASASSTPLLTRTNVPVGAGRVFTVDLRGDATVTSTTAANRPILDVFFNI